MQEFRPKLRPLEATPAASPAGPGPVPVREADVLIVGAGFSGIIMALEARARGFHDIVILEKADDFGGTWRENTYPGVACDIPSHLYALARHPKPDWSRTYAPGREIWAYMREVARREGLYDLVRFGRTFTGADWDAAACRWRVATAEGGRYAARVLVVAIGPLHVPDVPDIPGRDRFRGPVFHSARWDHSVELAGKRVAVIGTGASAVQFVPEVAKVAGRLSVHQRTPPWVLPRHDGAIPPWLRWLYARVPGLATAARGGHFALHELQHDVFRGKPRAVRRARRLALGQMRRAIRDPALRARLTPDYEIGCKRILFSNDWYPALARDNVEVVPGGVAGLREHAVVGADGVVRPADAVILGTGFRVTEAVAALAIRGLGGRTIGEAWANGLSAWLGAAVSGFPNLFFMLGPNTGLGHNSVLLMVEAQAAHVARLLAEMRQRGIEAVEPRPEVEAGFAAEMAERLSGMVWQAGGCTSWYHDAEGRNPTIWPGRVGEFRRRCAAAGLADYRPPGAAPR